MAKDPAALFFIDKWLIATKEMKADCRGWYLNLVMHQFDKKDLPNDVEELANLADVRHSEYNQFKQVFEQVLKHKFKLNDRGRLENEFAKEIIQNREQFKDQRSIAGKMSYFSKFMRKICRDENIIRFVLKQTNFDLLDLKDEQMLKQVFEQTSKLYINEIVNENEIVNKDIDSSIGIVNNIDIREISLKILTDFKFNEITHPQKLRQISDFVRRLISEKRIEVFKDQYLAYWKYKKITSSQLQSLDTFINDGWDRENWVEKLIENGKRQTTEAKRESVADAAQAAREILRGG